MKVCKHDRVLRCVDCEVEKLRSKVEEMQNAMQGALIHINDGNYRAAETEINKALEG